MKESILKCIEIWFRRVLIQLLGWLFRRENMPPLELNYNRCKFLFIRQDMIGDALISTPLFAILKKKYPATIVDVLLGERNYIVLENDPSIRKRWLYKKNLMDIFSLIRSLRKERYDFAIDLLDNPSATSTVLCLLAKAKWNVGIAKDNSFVYDIQVPMLSRKDTHIIDRIAQLLTPFGINPSEEQLIVRYFLSSNSVTFADQFLKQKGLLNNCLLGVNISAGSKVRFWGVENFQGLLKYIVKTYPEYKPLLLYKPSDLHNAKLIIESNPAVFLAPVTSTFDQFAALIKRLTFLITPDTSAVHLASAFKIGTLVLYVQSDKALRIWEPYNTDYEAVITDVDDLSRIQIKDVQDSLDKLIKRYKSKSPV